MKAIKKIGLAALTALTAMAFVGASSAMAESITLCSGDNGSGCGVTHVHETSVGKAKLLTSLGTIECNALYLGDTLAALANPLVIHGTFTYSNCTLGGSSCSATQESGSSEAGDSKEGHETALVEENFLVNVVCGSIIICSYSGLLQGTYKGPLLSTQANGETTFSEQPVTRETSGFACSKTAKLDITTSPLSATYISS